MNYEEMSSKERGIAEQEARFGFYRNYSNEQLKEEKLKAEEDLFDWTKIYNNPTCSMQKKDAEYEKNQVEQRLEFIEKVLQERIGDPR